MRQKLESLRHVPLELFSTSSQPCGFRSSWTSPSTSFITWQIPSHSHCEEAIKSLAPVPSSMEGTLVSVFLVQEDHDSPFSSKPS